MVILENIVGNLRDAYALVDPETMLHSDELQIERIADEGLREFSFYTADGNLYDTHEGKARLSITRRDHNLVLRHIDDAFTELTSSKNYHPEREEALAAIAAESTVSIDLTQLRLQGDDNEWKYLVIPTRDYSHLNAEERKLAERVHGSGDAFTNVMRMLAYAGIQETRMYVLNPSYVQVQTHEGPIGRASWLSDFNLNSDFYADDRYVNFNYRLRGVRRRIASVSEPGAHEVRDKAEKNIYARSYITILKDPDQAVVALDDSTASGLLALVSQYYSGKQ